MSAQQGFPVIFLILGIVFGLLVGNIIGTWREQRRIIAYGVKRGRMDSWQFIMDYLREMADALDETDKEKP